MEIQFLGATQEVTGSCHLIKTANHQILVDCGLFQGGERSDLRNREPFPFDPATIDAVILTHSHIDHSGRLPLLVERGFNGPIYTHVAGKNLLRILLKDAAFLAEKDAEWENRKRARKHLKPISPIYTLADVLQTLDLTRGINYRQAKEILPGVKIRLQDAGHILGASIVELWLKENGVERKIVFSGDLGQRDSLISPAPTAIAQADLVVMESTYGDRNHRGWDATWDELDAIFNADKKTGGNILIPAFAVGRTQQLLYLFSKKYKEWRLNRWLLALDSPMAIETTHLYSRYASLLSPQGTTLTVEEFSPPGLQLCRTNLQSMKLNQYTGGAIIIAGSGMCTGGRILHHFKHNIWRRDCQVVIVGFQAEGTLGHALINGATEIKIWGESVKVGAKIHTLGGLSAHADQNGLLDWYRQFENRPRVVLVHGEKEPIRLLGKKLAGEAQAVFCPHPKDTLDLISGKKLDLSRIG